MKRLCLIVLMCVSLIGCGTVKVKETSLQPIELQLITAVTATHLLNAVKANEKDLNLLHAWTNRGMTILQGLDPNHPETLQEALLELSQDPQIPLKYRDVTALVVVILTGRIDIDLKASQDFDKALALSHAVLKGLQKAIEQKQETLNVRMIILA